MTTFNNFIIALSGRKGAGKNTIAENITDWFKFKYPHKSVCSLSFADTLKDFCIETLGLDQKQCYGTEEEKNSFTQYKWDDVDLYFRIKAVYFNFSNVSFMEVVNEVNSPTFQLSTLSKKSGYMTGRDIMQLFGTELIRMNFGNVWADSTVRKIRRMNHDLSIITDNRFPNEVKSILDAGGYVIRLTRSPFGKEDMHLSESSLDNYDWNKPRCFVLDNQNLNEFEQNEKIIELITKIEYDWNKERGINV